MPEVGGEFVAGVLTGGASRRMGRDKATLPVGGAPMGARVSAAARDAGAAETVCVGLAVPGEAHLTDDHPGSGPLGGLLTALRWAGGRPVVVLGCDLVDPSPAAIGRAVARLLAVDAADVAVPVARGREQWLHAAWAPSALAPLEAAFAAGERAVHRAVAGLVVHRYDEHDIEALADADTPEDLPRDAR